MHLYKPACADIPTSKLGLPKSSESALKCRRHIAVTKPPPRAACWPVRPSGAAEWKCLEKFLRVHGISLQETTRAETGMAYSSSPISLPQCLRISLTRGISSVEVESKLMGSRPGWKQDIGRA
uniref:Potassium voltage-gated channel subfamily A member regulatory beta subunit 1 n=1 Tax=Rousettus aegyptiacus TaxID=9407 RepID=A0A7J8HRG8_ROUAE|nr:potassium voltage-gated channel subfamily A member regulatory beta subunit 1 [Rousettus aegyptiacus]